MVQTLPTRLDTQEALALHIDRLVTCDPRLAAVRAVAGAVDPRVSPRGFSGMAKVICGQQLSVASARAIWSRFEALAGATEPHSFLALSEETVRATGFSAGKFRTVRVIAEAITAGDLDFEALETLQIDKAIAVLTALKGIGPWTAEIYMMFCAGHSDVFPAGDLALQKAVEHGLKLNSRPTSAELYVIAALWTPHRAAAALLFWRYFAAIKERDGVAL
ncbi:DNA-3-methyladenine glycosylase 2 family protein [Devosia rhodophyticola]|uniref:DNA-3-methyladenine glycosylase II n=1 Tax=Devosia rhodophyticola TaxID=3026423 RepID=A0ABY7YUV0_9HYPH|nr:DNA-3-methyladenine glycosylase 2 family protein [Devosia rhodophyticola]WDR04635.1 DNA-3-methyladenine glycosylase 2 family protein [Devosia rhodophyticola]